MAPVTDFLSKHVPAKLVCANAEPGAVIIRVVGSSNGSVSVIHDAVGKER
jgi:hypothetical protein